MSRRIEYLLVKASGTWQKNESAASYLPTSVFRYSFVEVQLAADSKTDDVPPYRASLMITFPVSEMGTQPT
jgi:hypothetical protein